MLGNRLLKVLFVAFLSVKGTFACVSGTSVSEEDYKQVGTTIYRECYCDSENTMVNLRWVYPNGTDIGRESLLGSKSRRIFAVKRDQPYVGLDLHIPKLTLSMSGTYKCVYEDNGQIYTLQNYTVIAFESLYFLNKPVQFISLNKNSTISCDVKGGAGALYISWKKMKDKQILQNINDGEKYETKGNELIVKNVDNEDEGTYICDVLDMKGTESKNYTITVEVMVEPVIEELILTPEAVVVEGESLYIECKANGTPYPEFIWRRISDTSQEVWLMFGLPYLSTTIRLSCGRMLVSMQFWDTFQNPAESNSTGVIKMNELSFEKITPDDHGTYECIAKNRAGEDRRQIDIKVLVAPKIVQFSNKTETEGNVTQLVCDTISRPESEVTIIFLGKNEDNTEITDADIYENFKFLNVTPAIEGYYICNASNEVNYTEEKMYLSVLHQPYFKVSDEILWGWPGATVNLSCESDANPMASVTWRYMGRLDDNEISAEVNNQIKVLMEQLNKLPDPYLSLYISNETELYGDYECTATNELGSKQKRITLVPGFVPPPVSNVSGEIKATEAVFRIVKPIVHGPDLIGYTAEYDEDANYKVTNIHKNRTWSIDREQEGFKLEGLTPDTMYQIKFAAKNEIGVGEWGQIYKFSTLKPSAPSPPTWEAESEFLNVTENQILKWKAPDDNGDPIDNYIVRYCQDCKDEEKLCNEMITSNSILHMDTSVLSANSTYCIHLQAKNTIGVSVATNVTVTTPANLTRSLSSLPTGAIIGISIMVVLLALLVLDMLLCMCRRQGMIAHCYYNNRRTRNDENLQIRDKKGLLKDNCEPPEDNTKKHKEFEYNKTTGIITGKHSSV